MSLPFPVPDDDLVSVDSLTHLGASRLGTPDPIKKGR